MALSLSGRKLFLEVVACVAALGLSAVALTHRRQTEQFLANALGVHVPTMPATEQPTTHSDDGIVRTSHGRSVELTAKAYGHFFADAEINGRSISVMVDTGASTVALTYDDARRAGVLPRDSDFTCRSSTASGIAKCAPIEIDRITIGDIDVRNVQGVVMEDGKLQTTLLGMSFLSKLNVQIKAGRLVLEE